MARWSPLGPHSSVLTCAATLTWIAADDVWYRLATLVLDQPMMSMTAGNGHRAGEAPSRPCVARRGAGVPDPCVSE